MAEGRVLDFQEACNVKPKGRVISLKGKEGKIWMGGRESHRTKEELSGRAGPGADAPDEEAKSTPPTRKHLNSLRSEHRLTRPLLISKESPS